MPRAARGRVSAEQRSRRDRSFRIVQHASEGVSGEVRCTMLALSLPGRSIGLESAWEVTTVGQEPTPRPNDLETPRSRTRLPTSEILTMQLQCNCPWQVRAFPGMDKHRVRPSAAQQYRQQCGTTSSIADKRSRTACRDNKRSREHPTIHQSQPAETRTPGRVIVERAMT